MAYWFIPPTRTETHVLAGQSLRYSFETFLTAYRVDGQWVVEETPNTDVLQASEEFLAGRAQIISNTLAAELISQGIGTCVQIEA